MFNQLKRANNNVFSYVKLNEIDDQITELKNLLQNEQTNLFKKKNMEHELSVLENKLEDMYEYLEDLEDARHELQEAEYELSQWRKENETLEA
tara:strand:+ start:163 stop:441 length:279 start_codon:yes stop_codon:yes gene_type:complete